MPPGISYIPCFYTVFDLLAVSRTAVCIRSSCCLWIFCLVCCVTCWDDLRRQMYVPSERAFLIFISANYFDSSCRVRSRWVSVLWKGFVDMGSYYGPCLICSGRGSSFMIVLSSEMRGKRGFMSLWIWKRCRRLLYNPPFFRVSEALLFSARMNLKVLCVSVALTTGMWASWFWMHKILEVKMYVAPLLRMERWATSSREGVIYFSP